MQTAFLIALAVYCLSSFALIGAPLAAAVYFLWFRSVAAPAPFLHLPGFAGEPYFTAAIACFSLQAAVMAARRWQQVRINRVAGWFLLFVALVLAASTANFAAAVERGQSVDDLLKIALPLFGYLAFLLGMRTEADLARGVRWVMLTSVIPVGAGLVEAALGIGFNYPTGMFLAGERPAGTIVDANLYGITLALTFFAVLPAVLVRRSRANLLYLGLVVAAAVLSRNRGTWIALALSLLVAVPLFRHRLNARRWLVGGLVVAALAAPVLLSRFDELEQRDQWGQSKNTGAFRLELAEMLSARAFEAPFLGHGAGASVDWITGFQGFPMPPHDDYVRVAYDYGFPAMLAYAGFLFAQLAWTLRHRAGRLWPYHFAACGAQVYLIVISTAQNLLTEMGVYMLVFFLMALSHRAAVLEREHDPIASDHAQPPLRRRPSRRSLRPARANEY